MTQAPSDPAQPEPAGSSPPAGSPVTPSGAAAGLALYRKYRPATFAEVRLALDSKAVIGRNISPAVTAGSPRTRWKYRLSTKISP